MSARSEIKFRADQDIKDQFDSHCAALGTDRTARLIALIIADLEGRIAASSGGRPAPQKPVSDTDKMLGAFDSLKASLDGLFTRSC